MSRMLIVRSSVRIPVRKLLLNSSGVFELLPNPVLQALGERMFLQRKNCLEMQRDVCGVIDRQLQLNKV